MYKTLLNKHFGFNTFRKGQEEVIDKILSSQSAIAIFPTGSGKSICYQLPALELKHTTIVISPLLALIQDQISFLERKGIKSSRIDSTLNSNEEKHMMESIRNKTHKILFISVERFRNERFRNFLKTIPISLLVIDEAHCISQWGHNFRPDYLKIPQYKQEFNIENVLLLTATASPEVVSDMASKFLIQEENIFITGFYRENLFLDIKSCKQEEKITYCTDILSKSKDESSIVYVTQQKTAEILASELSKRGINAVAFHAGLKSEQKEEIQKQFMSSKKKCIVATIAFGMGIDKSDIRNIIHYDLPKSIENYSQEIGRAGRDGKASRCTVLANGNNINVLENFIYGDTPSKESIYTLLGELEKNTNNWEIIISRLASTCSLRQLPLKTLLVHLEILGLIKSKYSYYAQYRFFFIKSKEEIESIFSGEKLSFIQAIFDKSKIARKWASVEIKKIINNYNCDRKRISAALDFLHEKNLINLEASLLTESFEILKSFDKQEITNKLYSTFVSKETQEIEKLNSMISFFENDKCISKNMASYYGEKLFFESCNHCSICENGKTKIITENNISELQQIKFEDIFDIKKDSKILNLADKDIAKFLCGINLPLFSKMKIKSHNKFSFLDKFRIQDVIEYVISKR